MSSEDDPGIEDFPITEAGSFPEALGESEAFLEFQERLSYVAKVDRPVLLIGERGVGKELAARRLHHVSNRWQGPFVALNCAALSPSLIESELFGHEAGAFTGATRKRAGRFQMADGGTLFLDEIGNIPIQTQEKILRTVEYGTFEPVGASQTIRVDVRILGATNVDLVRLCEEGKFKRDLLDRLSFDVLFLPPLRHRTGDIELLANHFASRMAYELGRDSVPTFSEKAQSQLLRHDWPGNVRELKNVVERAVYLTDSNEVRKIVFDPFGSGDPHGSRLARKTQNNKESNGAESSLDDLLTKSYETAVKEFHIRLLSRALEKSRHNQKKAAQLLGMTYHQFRWLHQKYRQDLEAESG